MLNTSLEANEEKTQHEALLPWRSRFFDDAELRRQMLERLVAFRSPERDSQCARDAYVNELRRTEPSRSTAQVDRLRGLLDRAKSVLAEARSAEHLLLQQLGLFANGARPAAILYQLLSNVEDARMRSKVGAAWRARRSAALRPLLPVIDRMVDERRSRAFALGYVRPIDEILARCTATDSEIGHMLHDYLERAMTYHERLLARLGDAMEGPEGFSPNFARHVRSIVGDVKTPTFSLDQCLTYIFHVASATFALSFRELSSERSGVVRVEVAKDGVRTGEIHFQLWGSRRGSTSGDAPRSPHPATTHAPAQVPVAHVFCGVRRLDGTPPPLTFEDVQGLFHEFGHAIHHMLVARRVSHRSGLEYAPIERLEYLSMWFEKWAYHSTFAEVMASPGERDAPRICQRVKAIEYGRTHLERAAVAALDWRVHCATSGGLQPTFDALDREYGIGRHLALPDLLEYFTWPMFQANPGGSFAYVWGAAESAENFADFHPLDLARVVQHHDLRARLIQRLDVSARRPAPSVGSVFAFYEGFAGEARACSLVAGS